MPTWRRLKNSCREPQIGDTRELETLRNICNKLADGREAVQKRFKEYDGIYLVTMHIGLSVFSSSSPSLSSATSLAC